jgi:hypothetical protein
MTANDVNTFISRSGGVHEGGKGIIGTSSQGDKGQVAPLQRAPMKFPARTLLHHGPPRKSK